MIIRFIRFSRTVAREFTRAGSFVKAATRIKGVTRVEREGGRKGGRHNSRLVGSINFENVNFSRCRLRDSDIVITTPRYHRPIARSPIPPMVVCSKAESLIRLSENQAIRSAVHSRLEIDERPRAPVTLIPRYYL